MTSSIYTIYTKEELIELIEQIKQEKQYTDLTNEMLNKEVKILRNELYTLIARVKKVDDFKNEISKILETKQQCKSKVSNIKDLITC